MPIFSLWHWFFVFWFLAFLIKSYRPSTQKNVPDLNFAYGFREWWMHTTPSSTRGSSRGLWAPGYELQCFVNFSWYDRKKANINGQDPKVSSQEDQNPLAVCFAWIGLASYRSLWPFLKTCFPFSGDKRNPTKM